MEITTIVARDHEAGQHMFSRVGMAGFTLPFGSAVYLEEEEMTMSYVAGGNHRPYMLYL